MAGGIIPLWSLALANDGQSGNEANALIIYPPILEATAYRGDIRINNSLTLYPSAAGDLQLYADGTLSIGGTVTLSDADPRLAADGGQSGNQLLQVRRARTRVPGVCAHARASKVRPVAIPARLVARHGDIEFDPRGVCIHCQGNRIFAGGDIRNLNTLIQNVNADDVSVVQRRPRSRVFPAARSERADPGCANRHRRSGTRRTGGRKSAATSISALRAASARWATRQIRRSPTRAPTSSCSAASTATRRRLEAFADKYDVGADLPTVLDKFYGILRASGRRNAPLPNEQRSYADAFEAIKTLFPASDYQGSMDMFFSRVYTLDGGDIDVLMPGGGVNVGPGGAAVELWCYQGCLASSAWWRRASARCAHSSTRTSRSTSRACSPRTAATSWSGRRTAISTPVVAPRHRSRRRRPSSTWIRKPAR